MRESLHYLRLKRIVPGVAQGRPQERRNSQPLRVWPQRLIERLSCRESGIHAIDHSTPAGNRGQLRQIRVTRQELGTTDCVRKILNLSRQQVPIVEIVYIKSVTLDVIERQRVVVLRLQRGSAPPYSAIANISRFNQQVGRQFALQVEAPLQNARRAARIAVDGNEWRLGRTESWRNFKWIVGREIRPHNRCITEAVAGPEDIAVRELAELLRERRRRRVEIGNAVRQICIVR